MKTIIEHGEFKNSKTISIWEVDEEGRKEKYPLLGFGLKKAKAILLHIEEIKEFIKTNEKSDEQ
jgi:hypothetical protein